PHFLPLHRRRLGSRRRSLRRYRQLIRRRGLLRARHEATRLLFLHCRHARAHIPERDRIAPSHSSDPPGNSIMNVSKRSQLACAVAAFLAAGCTKAPPESSQVITVPTEAQVTEQSKALVPTGPWAQGDERGMGNTIGNGTWMRCAYYLGQPG